MKKTDLFKLMLVFTMVLLGSIWNNTIAQEQKAGPQAGAVGSGSSQQADEQKLKQRQEEPAKRAAEYAQKQEAEKQAKMAARAKAARPNEVANQQKAATAEAPINGLKSMDQTVASSNVSNNGVGNQKPNLTQIARDFDAQVKKITAAASTYREAKLQIIELRNKTLEKAKLVESDPMWEDFNNNLTNSISVETLKLQERLTSNSKN